ncbi:MAG: leucine--tRNA ligase, partial [Bermanella sp.]
HPLSGKEVPIWVANFVLMGYGTGAVMSVPAHDQRDFEFAKKYDLEINQVIATPDDFDISQAAFTEKGKLINSGEFDGLNFNKAFKAIAYKLTQEGKGKTKTNYRLTDWGVSRQRYWGTPVPMINKQNGEQVTAPEEMLPIVLPTDVVMDGVNSPIKNNPDFENIEFGGEQAFRETDTFDTFMESSWYYARYCSPTDDMHMVNPEEANYWLPVDQYIGGIEHAILHLLYARFFHKLLRDTGLVKGDEPFKSLLCQGMVLADAFSYTNENGSKEWVNPADVEAERDEKGRLAKATFEGNELNHEGMIKMSKSKNNGVDPQEAIDIYGADVVRLYTMFAAPPEQSLEWSNAGVQGAQKFLQRVWRLAAELINGGDVVALNIDGLNDEQKAARRKVHETIQKVSDDIARRNAFNTAIAAVMELTNTLVKLDKTDEQSRAVLKEGLVAMVKMLAPIAPHMCHELWKEFGNDDLVLDAPWPDVDEAALVRDSITIVVQVNGKVRGKLEMPANIDKDGAIAAAKTDANVQKFLEGATIRKEIYVPGKLVNIVAN